MDINIPPTFGKDVVYKECRHNLAASIGGKAQDGCREFLKAGEDGTMEAMLCAACGCHRSFHRKVIRLNPIRVPHNQNFLNVVVALPDVNQPAARVRSDLGADELEMTRPGKRKRTRFTAEQISRMMAFAESYDWKVYRRAGKAEIKRFCMEIGVYPKNFKVWLGNQRRPSKGKNATTTKAVAAAV